eukprot:g2695.t1
MQFPLDLQLNAISEIVSQHNLSNNLALKAYEQIIRKRRSANLKNLCPDTQKRLNDYNTIVNQLLVLRENSPYIAKAKRQEIDFLVSKLEDLKKRVETREECVVNPHLSNCMKQSEIIVQKARKSIQCLKEYPMMYSVKQNVSSEDSKWVDSATAIEELNFTVSRIENGLQRVEDTRQKNFQSFSKRRENAAVSFELVKKTFDETIVTAAERNVPLVYFTINIQLCILSLKESFESAEDVLTSFNSTYEDNYDKISTILNGIEAGLADFQERVKRMKYFTEEHVIKMKQLETRYPSVSMKIRQLNDIIENYLTFYSAEFNFQALIKTCDHARKKAYDIIDLFLNQNRNSSKNPNKTGSHSVPITEKMKEKQKMDKEKDGEALQDNVIKQLENILEHVEGEFAKFHDEIQAREEKIN